VSIANNGIWDTPIQLKYTPTANETLFQVRKTDNFGIRLEGSFNAGEQIIYDTSDNTLTIDGTEQNLAQFRTGGSVFNIDPGTNDIYVQCSGAGTFAYEFNERYS
jgi:phage-related protein